MTRLMEHVRKSRSGARETSWIKEAVNRIDADFARSADTHLIKLDLPRMADAGIDYRRILAHYYGGAAVKTLY